MLDKIEGITKISIGTEVAVGPKFLGAEVSRTEVSRGRSGSGAEVSVILYQQ